MYYPWRVPNDPTVSDLLTHTSSTLIHHKAKITYQNENLQTSPANDTDMIMTLPKIRQADNQITDSQAMDEYWRFSSRLVSLHKNLVGSLFRARRLCVRNLSKRGLHDSTEIDLDLSACSRLGNFWARQCPSNHQEVHLEKLQKSLEEPEGTFVVDGLIPTSQSMDAAAALWTTTQTVAGILPAEQTDFMATANEYANMITAHSSSNLASSGNKFPQSPIQSNKDCYVFASQKEALCDIFQDQSDKVTKQLEDGTITVLDCMGQLQPFTRLLCALKDTAKSCETRLPSGLMNHTTKDWRRARRIVGLTAKR